MRYRAEAWCGRRQCMASVFIDTQRKVVVYIAWIKRLWSQHGFHSRSRSSHLIAISVASKKSFNLSRCHMDQRILERWWRSMTSAPSPHFEWPRDWYIAANHSCPSICIRFQCVVYSYLNLKLNELIHIRRNQR